MGEQLYRLDLSCYAGRGNQTYSPLTCYLVRAESPAAAEALARNAVIDRWPDAREITVVRMWSYPSGPLVLYGAGQLQVGEPVVRTEQLPETGRAGPPDAAHSATGLQGWMGPDGS